MDKTSLPEAKDWNNFWGLEQTQKFTKVSWSKKRIMRILSKYVGGHKKALDAGCGSGFFSKYFCDQEMQTTSLDYSDEALKIATSMTNGRTQVLKRDLLSQDLSKEIDDRFDLIFTDGLFEHFSSTDQDKIMQNFVRILSKEGVIVTFVPNRWSPWELIRPFYMPGIEETPFTFKGLLDLNQRNGLFVSEKGGVNTFPFAISPDQMVGAQFGMLLYTVAQKNIR